MGLHDMDIYIHIYRYVCIYVHIHISTFQTDCFYVELLLRQRAHFQQQNLDREKPEQNPTIVTKTMKKLLLEYIFSLSKPIKYSIIKQHISKGMFKLELLISNRD